MPDTPETIAIEYDFTRDDYLRWTRELQDRAMGNARWRQFRKRRAGTLVFAIALSATCLFLGLTCWREVLDGQNMLLGGVILCIGAGAAGLWWQVKEYHRLVGSKAIVRKLESAADTDQGRRWQGHIKVSLTPEFFATDNGRGVANLRWSYVESITREDWLILVRAYTGGAWPIPVHAFADEPAAAAFIALANRYRDAAPRGPQEERRELLETRDAKCPGCGYNLRGTDGAKCPECGRAVGIGDVLRG